MNALARTTSAALPRASAFVQRRAASSATKEPSFKAIWLSDVSTYPILGILTIAVVGCSGFMLTKITTHPDVRISPKAKNSVLRL